MKRCSFLCETPNVLDLIKIELFQARGRGSISGEEKIPKGDQETPEGEGGGEGGDEQGEAGKNKATLLLRH